MLHKRQAPSAFPDPNPKETPKPMASRGSRSSKPTGARWRGGGGVRCLCYVVVLHAIAGSRS